MKLKYALIPKIGTSAFARGSTQLSILKKEWLQRFNAASAAQHFLRAVPRR
jgi:hypothetical protein